MNRPTIRPSNARDHGGIRAVLLAAFESPAECGLVTDLLADPPEPTVSLVADLEGEIIGHALFTPVSVEPGRANPWTAMALAPLAVRPAHQRTGIGSALTREGLARCRDLAPATFVLGDPAYYPRFGFRPACPMGYACAWARTGDEHAGAFMIADVAGAPREPGFVRYHPAFDRF